MKPWPASGDPPARYFARAGIAERRLEGRSAARCFARARIIAAAGCVLAAVAFGVVHLGSPQPLVPSAAGTTAARAPRVAGQLLVRYVVQVPAYHGLNFGPQLSRPFDTRGGSGADLLNRLYDYETRDRFVHVLKQPTYPLCRAATDFARTVVAELNKSFCYLGHGLVVGITVKAISTTRYHTFDITVWQA